jgi:ribosomal protein S3AE
LSRKPERGRAPKSEYVIRAPSYFGNREIGTTISDDPSKLIGRTVKVSLYNLTDDFTRHIRSSTGTSMEGSFSGA